MDAYQRDEILEDHKLWLESDGREGRRAELWRAELQISFQGADLRQANLQGAFVHGNYLREADLRGANLVAADLTSASLQGARLEKARLNSARLNRTSLRGANLAGADLRAAQLLRTDLRGADLTACLVWGAAVWDVQTDHGTRQSDLVIVSEGETAVTVDRLELAQFVYLLLEIDKLGGALETLGSKNVLLLGRFGERKKLLDRLRERLRELGFVPIVFDFKRPRDRDLVETVKTLVGLSAFVIADITAPRSVPDELEATVPDYMVPLKPILEKGEEPFATFKALHDKHDWVLAPLKYDSVGQLLEVLEPLVIAPALEMREELIRRRGEEMKTEDAGEYLEKLRQRRDPEDREAGGEGQSRG